MPEQNNGRKPFRRNSSGAESGFRRTGSGGGGGHRPSGGTSGGARDAAGRGGFGRDNEQTSTSRRAPEARGERPAFGRDEARGARQPDHGRGERTGSASARDRGSDRAGGRSGFRADSPRAGRDESRGYEARPRTRPYGERPERGFRERDDQRSQGRPGSDDRSRGGRGDRPDHRGGDDRRFGGRGGEGRSERATDRPQRRSPADSNSGGETGRYQRGGDRGSDGSRRRGGEGTGRGLDRRPPRPEEPDLPDDVQAGDLDSSIRRDLLSLDKGNAETVARHLAMAAQLLDDDPQLALAHARAARRRAGRIAVVRETAGVVAYHAGEWAEALSELRAARRMAGGSGLLAVMADCERGLGRPERAIEIGRSDEGRALTGDEAIELRIVVAGARMDLGQYDQAVVTLQTPDLDPARTGSGPARLFYAYADALVAAGRTDEGLTWFFNAAAADIDGETDAEERAAELTGGA